MSPRIAASTRHTASHDSVKKSCLWHILFGSFKATQKIFSKSTDVQSKQIWVAAYFDSTRENNEVYHFFHSAARLFQINQHDKFTTYRFCALHSVFTSQWFEFILAFQNLRTTMQMEKAKEIALIRKKEEKDRKNKLIQSTNQRLNQDGFKNRSTTIIWLY